MFYIIIVIITNTVFAIAHMHDLPIVKMEVDTCWKGTAVRKINDCHKEHSMQVQIYVCANYQIFIVIVE